MATFLRHQESTVRHDKNHVGWMWGFLHFFDFHHHLHVRKMLTDKKHTDGRHSQGEGLRFLHNLLLSVQFRVKKMQF